MKKIICGFILCLTIICCVASMRQQNTGVYISGSFGGEPKLQVDQPDQTVDWVLFRSNGVPVFRIPANGVLPVANGGTGAGSLVAFQPASANLTNWSGIAIGSKQPASLALTNLASVTGVTTNFQILDEVFTNTLYFTNGLLIRVTSP